jgi:DNA repair exonuclease SbcCD ATPase subunit
MDRINDEIYRLQQALMPGGGTPSAHSTPAPPAAAASSSSPPRAAVFASASTSSLSPPRAGDSQYSSGLGRVEMDSSEIDDLRARVRRLAPTDVAEGMMRCLRESDVYAAELAMSVRADQKSRAVEHASMKQCMDQQAAALAAAETGLRQRKQAQDELQERLNREVAERMELELQMQTIRVELAGQRSQLQSTQQLLERKRSELEQSQHDTVSAQASLQRKESELQEEREAFGAQLARLTEEVREAQKTNADLWRRQRAKALTDAQSPGMGRRAPGGDAYES